jgi:hypothetical protein
MSEPRVPRSLPGDIDCLLWGWLYRPSVRGREGAPNTRRVVARLDKCGQSNIRRSLRTEKRLDFIGGADADRTRDLLNAICGQGANALLRSITQYRNHAAFVAILKTAECC